MLIQKILDKKPKCDFRHKSVISKAQIYTPLIKYKGLLANFHNYKIQNGEASTLGVLGVSTRD